MTRLDINLELHSFRPHNAIKRGRLSITVSGKDTYIGFINALERIMTERIPTYGFPRELVKIDRINPETGYHDSIPFNHDMMSLRLSRFPVIGVDPEIAILHEKYWKNVDYLDKDREKHENEKRVEINIDVKNTASEADTESVFDVTTNNIEVYIDNELVDLFNKHYPLLVISLKPKEAFRCSMRAVLGVGLRDSLWNAASNAWHDVFEVKDSVVMNVEASSCFDEFALVERGLEYFKLRTKVMRDYIEKNYKLQDDPDNVFIVKLIGEDDTMGEPIAYELQSHPDIKSAATRKTDRLVDQIELVVSSFKADKMLTAVLESLDNLIARIDNFDTKFREIDRPSVTFDPFGSDDSVVPYGETAGDQTVKKSGNRSKDNDEKKKSIPGKKSIPDKESIPKKKNVKVKK